MGLHMHTRQDHDRAEIEVRGDISGSSLAQLDAAIAHFRSRGCTIVNVTLVPTECRRIVREVVDSSFAKVEEFAIRPV